MSPSMTPNGLAQGRHFNGASCSEGLDYGSLTTTCLSGSSLMQLFSLRVTDDAFTAMM